MTLLADPDSDRDDHPAVIEALSSGSIKLERECRGQFRRKSSGES